MQGEGWENTREPMSRATNRIPPRPKTRPLSAKRLLLAAAGFASGIAAALVIRWPAEPGRIARPAEVEPVAPARGRTASFPPPRTYDNVIRMPRELLEDPEVRSALEASEAGRSGEALAGLQAAHEKFPGYPEPLLALATIHLSRGELQDAVAAARKATRVAPEDAVPFLVLGRALEARGDRDAAEKAYLRAEELAPSDPRPAYHLGRIAAIRKHTDVAIPRFRRALELDPSYAPAAYGLADQLRESGSHDEAAAVISEALARRPHDTDLRLKLADIHLMRGDWESAAREFRRAAEAGADDPMVPYFLSKALEQLGRDDEAIEALRAALRLDPQLHHAWYALYRLLEKTGDAAGAERALSGFQKARALQDSIVRFQGHLERHPRDLEALLELGKLLLERGVPGEALEVARKALALDPQDPRALALLSRAEAESKKLRAEKGRTRNPPGTVSPP